MQIEWTSATVRSWFSAYAQCPVHKGVQNSAVISHTLVPHFEITIQKTLLTLVDKIRKMDPKYKIIWRNIITNNTRNTHGFFQMSIFPHQLLRHVNHLRRGRLRFSETGIMLERVAAVHRPRRPITFAQGTMSFRCRNKEPLYTPSYPLRSWISLGKKTEDGLRFVLSTTMLLVLRRFRLRALSALTALGVGSSWCLMSTWLCVRGRLPPLPVT